MDRDDYESRLTPLHRSLNQQKTIAGADRGIVIFIGTLTTVATVVFKTPMWIPLALLLHMFMVWVHKQDPLMKHIYLRYSMQQNRYDPWPHVKITRNSRPDGFDKGNLC